MTDSTPIARLRELHRHCEPCIFNYHWFVVGRGDHCHTCLDAWPCLTIAALDALEAERVTVTETVVVLDQREMQARLDALEEQHSECAAIIEQVQSVSESWERDYHAVFNSRKALQARLDAATVLIRQAIVREHYGRHGGAAPTTPAPATCHACKPYRAWLAGDKEENGE